VSELTVRVRWLSRKRVIASQTGRSFIAMRSDHIGDGGSIVASRSGSFLASAEAAKSLRAMGPPGKPHALPRPLVSPHARLPEGHTLRPEVADRVARPRLVRRDPTDRRERSLPRRGPNGARRALGPRDEATRRRPPGSPGSLHE